MHTEDLDRPSSSPTSRKAVVVIAVAVFALILAGDTLFPEPSLWFGDLALKIRGARPLDSRIVLIDIEEWPRPRDLLAKAVRAVARMGPRVIALDVLLDIEKENPGHNADLAAAIAEAGCVVVPAAIERSARGEGPTPLLQQFARGALHIGFANFELDFDGVVRRLPLTHRDPPPEEGSLPGEFLAFAPAIVNAWHSRTRKPALPAAAAGSERPVLIIDWCETARDRLPVASLSMLVNNAAYRQGLETVEFCRDKIAFIGYLGIRYVGDGFLTPLSKNTMDRSPGAVIHVNALSNLLQNRRLTRAAPPHVAVLALLGSLAGALAGRWRLSMRLFGLVTLASLGALVFEAWVLSVLSVHLNLLPAAAGGLGALAMANLLSAQVLLRVPLVRRVVALFGVQQRHDVAILNIVSDPAPSGGIVRYTFQIRQGEGPGAIVSASRSTSLPDSFENLTHKLDGFLRGETDLSPQEELSELGRDIRSEFLSREAEQELARLDVRHVHIELGEHDLSIPWELADIDGRPLSERFGVSRSVVHEGADQPPGPPPVRDGGFLALVVANPWPLAGNWEPLPAAEEEARHVERELAPLARIEPLGLRVEVLKGEAATLAAVTARLSTGEVDIFHFSGHAVFDTAVPEGTGFVFPEGILGPSALGALVRETGVPPIVFANACNTARAQPRELGKNRVADFASRLSLPSTFLQAGARLYLGCLWAVETEAATRFAIAFYRQLIRGATAGQALTRARAGSANYWMTHAAYVMYGDPRLTLARRHGDS